MLPSNDFADFKARFLKLANKAKKPRNRLKDHLWLKLYDSLRNTIEPTVNLINGFDEFCLATSLLHEKKRLVATQRRKESNSTSNSSNNSSKASKNQFPRNTTTPKVDYNKKTEPKSHARPNSDDITCYRYNKKGHIAPNCPEPKTSDLKELDQEEEEEIDQLKDGDLKEDA
ncbi:hypothetical protein BKA61DRAFT_700663 [Leptodontidium sp. MPI-SDFR-AT-0119]|nr:hypothetical protein BKA61DRAFT_700663 [Leptodontidium sp. MPI-SDFR-AT-0119]